MNRRYKINRKLRQSVKANPCIVCGSQNKVDPCHIRSFGSSGIEEEWNLVPMCRDHHNEQHKLGWWRFCAKYPKALRALHLRDWNFMAVNGQWKLINEKEIA